MGDRLGFVIVTQPSYIPPPETGIKSNNMGLKMRLSDYWMEHRATESPIDAMYYIHNLCMGPIDQLFSTVYDADLEANGLLSSFCYRPRSNVCYQCNTPIKMSCALVKSLISAKMRKAGGGSASCSGGGGLTNEEIAHTMSKYFNTYVEKIVSLVTTKTNC